LAAEIGQEHPIARDIQSDTDALHQMGQHISGVLAWASHRTYTRFDGVAARRIRRIRPIKDAMFKIELQIDRFRQAVKQHFDIGAMVAFHSRNFDICAQTRPCPAFSGPFCVQ